MEGGAYRVLPDQRVNFEHGSLREVVDHEPESCGCPPMPVTSVADGGKTGNNPALPGRPVGGPSSTPADTAFPIAESEGLAAPPAPSTVPTVPPGETHAQVTVPLTYNAENPPASTPAPLTTTSSSAGAPPIAATSPPPAPEAAAVTPAPQPATPADEPAAPAEVASAPVGPSATQGGLFHRIGHFFSRIFGK